MKFEISKVERSKTNNEIIIITAIDGTRYSGFAEAGHKSTGLAELAPGDVINAEIKVNNKFNNILQFTKLDTVPLPPKDSVPTPQSVNGPERGCAYNKIMDAWIAGKWPDNHVFVQWAFKETHRITGV